MKKLALAVVIIFSLFFCVSCGHGAGSLDYSDFIMLSLDISSNGQIVQSLDFSVNSSQIDSLSESEEEKLKFISNLTSQINDLRTEFLFSYTLKYIQNPVEEYKLNKGLLITGSAYNSSTDTVGFNLIFTSLGAWNYYHSSGENEEEEDNGNIFLKKSVSGGLFPFSNSIKLNEEESIYVGERYRQKYIESAEGLSFKSELEANYSPELIYNYSTFYSRLHSDCDFNFTDSSGHTHHVWTVNSNSLTGENSIEVYSYQINTGMWYLFALIKTIVLAVILYIIFERKRIGEYFKNLKDIKKT